MRVLVTGSAGFVGQRLLPRLRAEGFEVFGCDREVDVTDPAQVDACFERTAPDAVVHLAAQSSVAASFAEPLQTYRVNYLGTRSILLALRDRAPGARLLLIGSADQYGSAAPGAVAFTERTPLRPASPYAWTKVAAELLGAAYARAGLDVVRVRAFNHTGAGQADAFVLASFARQIAEIERGVREPVMRVGNLDSVRDFLDVDDVIEAYVALLRRDVEAGVYNIASGRGVPVRELLDALLERSPTRPRIEVDPDRFRPTDFSAGDASRLRAACGWQPRIPLSDTLDALLEHARAQLSPA